jgi:hypothetical protein
MLLLYIYLKIIGLENITINPKIYENIDEFINQKNNSVSIFVRNFIGIFAPIQELLIKFTKC